MLGVPASRVSVMKSRRQSKAGDEPRLYPYQRRWVEDNSRFKIACKARQIGFTFAAAWRVVDQRLAQPGLTLWISASERQALEAMEHIRRFCRELRIAALYEEEFIEGTLVKQRVVKMPNGSRIIALPANPDTVRGFAGDVVLDEFAFHRDAEAIWRAAFATATRGFQIEIISTPNGTHGKYYELAKAAGLVDFAPFVVTPSEARRAESRGLLVEKQVPRLASLARDDKDGGWSAHWVDLGEARAQGFKVDVEALRSAIADDDAWQQEYCCRFLSEASHFIPPELVVAAESSSATTTLGEGTASRSEAETLSERSESKGAVPKAMLRAAPPGKGSGENRIGFPQRPCYIGVDIGRKRDLTVLWLLEVESPQAPPEARTYLTRGVQTLDRQPFAQQRAVLDALLALRGESEISHLRFEIQRCAVDATGLGAMLAEELATRWGARVEPIVFTGAVKEALAVRVKRLLEERRLKIPYDPAIRAALGAIKRYVTPAGNVRFDAERTDAGHADHFWALALALHAAEEPSLSADFISSGSERAFARSGAF